MSDVLIAQPAVGGVRDDDPGDVATQAVGRRRRRSWPRLGAVIVSGAVVLLALGWTLAPSLFASGDPYALTPRDKLQPPSARHWFGTDNIGRDLYTRVVHGAQLSLTATVSAVAIALAIGALLGLIAGSVGGLTDSVLMRVVDVLLSIPQLLLSLALVTALGFGTSKVAIAVGVTLVASFARVMRSEVLRVRHAPYVEAAFVAGARWPSVLVNHILRNSLAPVLGLAVVQAGLAVLLISSLSFLGFGATPPSPEWGSLLAEGRNFLATAWWMTAIPGVVIVAIVVCANHLGHVVERRR